MARLAIAERTLITAKNAEALVTWINRGLETLWLLAVVLVPLAFVTPDDMISAAAIAFVEVPKIALLRTLAGLMAVLWLVELVIEGRFEFPAFLRARRPNLDLRGWARGLGGWLRGHPERWLTLAVGFYLASTFLSTVLSASLAVSMWGEVPGEDGYATYTVIAYVLLFAVVATHLKTPAQMGRLLGAVVIMGVLVAGYAVLQHYGHPPLDIRFPFLQNQGPFNMGDVSGPQPRATSTMGNPILAGSVMLMTISISLAAAVITLRESWRTTGFWWKLGLWTLVLTVQFLGIIFTASRGPWLGTAVALAAFLMMVFMCVGWRFLARATLVLGLSMSVAWAILVLPSLAPTASTSGGGEVNLPAGAGNLKPNVSAIASSEVSRLLISASNQVTGRGLTGRMEIWTDSWRLMVDHPWYEFDSLSLSYLRPAIGYGPDLFRYAYLLESPPLGTDQVPRESVHAHSFFIHQGVETGFLGLLASLGIYVVPVLMGGYYAVRHRRSYSAVHSLVLASLLATVAARSMEQAVGLARVSDLTIFWVLLAAMVALPVAMRPSQGPPGPSRRVRAGLSLDRQRVWPVLAALVLIVGVGALTWVKTVNYPRAAVIAAGAVRQTLDGDLQGAQSSFGRAIELAPDVWANYDRRAAVFFNYASDQQLPQEQECGRRANAQPYEECLTEKAYLDGLAGAGQRPFNFRSRHALARSASALATLSGDEKIGAETLRFSQEVTQLVPNAWPLLNLLAVEYLSAGEAEAALEPLEKSLAITGNSVNSAKTRLIRGITYRELGRTVESVSDFDELIRLTPDDNLAFNHRALTYFMVGQPQQALKDLDEAVRIDPKYAEGYSNLGYVHRQLGRPLSALSSLDEAIRLDPEFGAAYNNRGLVYADLDNHEQAIEDYDEAIRLDSSNLQAYLNRGVEYVDLGRPESALQDSEQVIRLDPRRAGAYALRAMAYTQLGADVEAGQDLTRAVNLGFSRPSLEATIEDLKSRR